MSIHLRQHSGSNGVFYVSDRANGVEIKQTEGFEEMSNGKKGTVLLSLSFSFSYDSRFLSCIFPSLDNSDPIS